MNLTKDELVDTLRPIASKAAEIANAVIKAEGWKSWSTQDWTDADIDLVDEEISFKEFYCGDYDHLHIPFDALFESPEAFVEKRRAAREAQAEALRRKAEEQLKANKASQEALEFANYQRLKAKYEGA